MKTSLVFICYSTSVKTTTDFSPSSQQPAELAINKASQHILLIKYKHKVMKRLNNVKKYMSIYSFNLFFGLSIFYSFFLSFLCAHKEVKKCHLIYLFICLKDTKLKKKIKSLHEHIHKWNYKRMSTKDKAALIKIIISYHPWCAQMFMIPLGIKCYNKNKDCKIIYIKGMLNLFQGYLSS